MNIWERGGFTSFSPGPIGSCTGQGQVPEQSRGIKMDIS